MYKLIESLTLGDETTQLYNRTVPAPCLIEDDDGIRALLLPDGANAMLVDTWVRAHSAGAAMILSRTARSEDPFEDAICMATSAETFMAHREEEQRTGLLRVTDWDCLWRGGRDPLSYTEFLSRAAEQAEQARAATAAYVALHTHSEMSRLDGLSAVADLVAAAVADGHPALAITDHGMCSAHPDLQVECDKAGINPIFGMEAYFVPDRHRRGKSWEELDEKNKPVKRSDSKEALGEYTHLCMWAMDDQGLDNLWAMSTEGYSESGLYGKPRIDWEVLGRLNAGVLASTGCLRGLIPQALLNGDELGARALLARMLDIFGDRFYVEIHTNHLPEQRQVNKQLVELAREFQLPVIAVSDSHYTKREDRDLHRQWLAVQTNSDITDDTGMFGGGQDYHFHTRDEALAALAYLGEDVAAEAVATTVALADRCTARMKPITTRPVYSKGENAVQRDVERLTAMCVEAWEGRLPPGADLDVYIARFEREMSLFISRELCGFMLVTADLVRWAKSQGILVGPCRGSGGASLVAYLCAITEVDPILYELPFERFLTEERMEMPDFDIDFPESKRGVLEQYLRERWGADCVIRIGNHVRVRALEAIDSALRVLRPALPYEVPWSDVTAIKEIIKGYAATLSGAVVEWSGLWEHHGEELEPYRAKYPEVFAMMAGIEGRLRTYGKHPSGMLISTTGPLTNYPLWRASKDTDLTTQFDFRQMDDLGHLKYDLLTLRTLDTQQMAVDLIAERHGVRIDFYRWRDEYLDPQVWDDLSAGHTLGVFQVETSSGTKLTKQYQPESILDLAAIAALNRPGPLKSGLTAKYLARRHGKEEVTFADDRLIPIMDQTYGTFIFQEQIMWICMALSGYGAGEADTKVRKVIAKKLGKEKMAAVGTEFIRRAVDCGTPREVAEELWLAMAEFAKYSFGKAHSVGYSILGYWSAWLKAHFPLEFFTAALTTVDSDAIPDYVAEARRMGYSVLPPDINESGLGFTPTDTVIRYGLAAVKGMTAKSADRAIAGRPYTSLEDFEGRMIRPEGSKLTAAHLKALTVVGALDSIYPNRRALEIELERRASGENRTCTLYQVGTLRPVDIPLERVGPPGCTFDWVSEEDPEQKHGKLVGRKPNKVWVINDPPKKCTIGCRQYSPPPPLDPDTITPYTEAEIREREKETLGVWLSSTPFDALAPEDRELVALASDVDAGEHGDYVVAALVNQVAARTDRNGNRYAFVTLYAQDGDLDTACWSDKYKLYAGNLIEGKLVLAVVRKHSRGLELTGLAPG